MLLGVIITASKILEHPDMMGLVEDPYVIVRPDTGLFSENNSANAVIRIMSLMHARGWETVNITVDHGILYALLKNPRAKQKNIGDA